MWNLRNHQERVRYLRAWGQVEFRAVSGVDSSQGAVLTYCLLGSVQEFIRI